MDEAEVDVCLDFPCFLYDPKNVGYLISRFKMTGDVKICQCNRTVCRCLFSRVNGQTSGLWEKLSIRPYVVRR